MSSWFCPCACSKSASQSEGEHSSCVMRLFVSKNLCISIAEDQRELVREAFAIMEDSYVFLFLFPVIDKFHGTPEGNMSSGVFSEYSVEQTSGAKQSDMAPVQRSQRPSAHI